MNTVYETVARLLAEGEDAVLATIMSKRGSAPRTTGAKMVIRRDGTFAGTIGGGLLEAKIIELSRDVFQSRTSVVHAFELVGADAFSRDMVCGGKVEVFLDFVSSKGPTTLSVFRAMDQLTRLGQLGILITELSLHPVSESSVTRCLVLQDGSHIGHELTHETVTGLLQNSALREGQPYIDTVNGVSCLVEPVLPLGTVYLFGAGHVSQQVARLTSMVDFRTVVIDDRDEFANRDRFPLAEDILVPESFEDCLKEIPVSDDSYLVIVTRSHQSDRQVLTQALDTSAGYIGLISSSRKKKLIYEALRDAGVTDEQLSRVHSPIGVPIGAETPEEIAVSIVAELIQARGQRLNHG